MFAHTADGQGVSVPIPSLTMAQVCLNITAGSGTFGGGEGLAVWLQGSDDEGLTWYDLPSDQQGKTAASGSEVDAALNRRNVTGTTLHTTTGAHQFLALYKHLAAKMIRAVWDIAGTTPSFTFTVVLVGK